MKKVAVINKTKELTILSEVNIADQFLPRLKGLLGSKGLTENAGLIIKPCNSVHSFFMKFPIDVAFIDKNGKVCHIMNSMKKNKMSPIIKNSYYVLETSAGTFVKHGLEVGDVIEVM